MYQLDSRHLGAATSEALDLENMETAARISKIPHLQSETSGVVELQAYFRYNIASCYRKDEMRYGVLGILLVLRTAILTYYLVGGGPITVRPRLLLRNNEN